MGIAAQIAKHGFWTGHRLFDIDDPVLPTQGLKKSPECLGIFQRPGGAVKAELVSAIVRLADSSQLAIPEWMLKPETCEGVKLEAKPRILVSYLLNVCKLIG